MLTRLTDTKNKSIPHLFAMTGAVLLAIALLSPLTTVHAEDKTSVKLGIMSGEDEDVWREVVK